MQWKEQSIPYTDTENLYPKAIKAVSGGLIPLKKIVSHVFDFKDCIHAIEYSNDHKDEVIKGVIKFKVTDQKIK